MSDKITINVTSGERITLSPVINRLVDHAATHYSGARDELDHNSLGFLQGGQSGEFYHLNFEQYDNLTTGLVVRPSETGVFYAASNPSGYISTGDADLRFVNVTGDETISGEKTFVNNVFFQSGVGVTGLIDFYLDQQAEPFEGQVGWHPDYGTLQIGMNAGEVINPVGFKNFYRVKAASTIRKGFVVMAVGSVGNSEYILAQEAANIGSSGQLIMGIAAEEILPNDFGDVVAFGAVRGVDTSAFQEGSILYYDPQSTGGLTDQVPATPNAKVIVALVTRQNNNGVVFTRVSAGSEFGVTDSNVIFSGLADNQGVFYNASSGVWFNKQISTGDVSGLYDFVTGTQGEFVTQTGADAQYVNLFTNQTISGTKTFDQRPIVSGLGVMLSGEAEPLPTTIVYQTGDQIISGNKSFADNLGLGVIAPTAKLDILDTTLAGSGSLSGSALNIAQTWNTTGAPTAIKLNVTDTASNASSLLMDFKVGGVSRFRVDKDGQFNTGGSTQFSEVNALTASTQGFLAIGRIGAASAESAVGISFAGLKVRFDKYLGFNSTNNLNNSQDLTLFRDAANTLAQRNGINPQTFRLYNTFTDATTDFERLNFHWDSNVAKIGTQKGTTSGVARDLALETDGTTRMTVTSGGDVGIGTLTPAEKLDVIGNVVLSNNSGLKIRNNVGTLRNVIKIDSGNQLIIGENAGPIYINSANDQYFVRGGAFKMTLGSNGLSINAGSTPPNSGVGLYVATGNVGIGTASPTAKLDILDTTLAGSGSLSGSALNIDQTWNTTGTPTAIKLNVTDTASNAASLLMDLRVGGVSRLSVNKIGLIALPPVGGDGTGVVFGGSTIVNARSYLGQYGLRLTQNLSVQWSASTNLNVLDLSLARDAANTLAQRNGINPQESRIYGTYTDTSNYRRLALKMSSAGVAQIVAEGGGSGAADNRLEFVTGGATRMTVAADGGASLNATASAGLKIMSPSGNPNDYLLIGSSGNNRVITSSANALGFSYQLIGDATGSGGPMELRCGSGGLFSWRSTARSDTGANDTGLSRNAAGVLEINNGTAGTFRDLKLRNLTASGTVTFGAGGAILNSPAAGIFTITNAAGTGFGRLCFGPATSSFAAFRSTGTTIDVVTGNESGFANMAMNNLTISGQLVVSNSPLTSNTNVAGTTGAQNAFTLSTTTNGVAAATFGPRLRFQAESASGTTRDAAAIDAVWTDATDATRTADIVFNTVSSAGALTERMRLSSQGNLTASGDIEATDSTKGVILKSPNGTRWRIIIDDSGELTATAL